MFIVTLKTTSEVSLSADIVIPIIIYIIKGMQPQLLQDITMLEPRYKTFTQRKIVQSWPTLINHRDYRYSRIRNEMWQWLMGYVQEKNISVKFRWTGYLTTWGFASLSSFAPYRKNESFYTVVKSPASYSPSPTTVPCTLVSTRDFSNSLFSLVIP